MLASGSRLGLLNQLRVPHVGTPRGNAFTLWVLRTAEVVSASEVWPGLTHTGGFHGLSNPSLSVEPFPPPGTSQ